MEPANLSIPVARSWKSCCNKSNIKAISECHSKKVVNQVIFCYLQEHVSIKTANVYQKENFDSA